MSFLYAASSTWKGLWQITLFNCILDSFAVKFAANFKHFVIVAGFGGVGIIM